MRRSAFAGKTTVVARVSMRPALQTSVPVCAVSAPPASKPEDLAHDEADLRNRGLCD